MAFMISLVHRVIVVVQVHNLKKLTVDNSLSLQDWLDSIHDAITALGEIRSAK